jgi:Ni,Fe-hydrogenase I cytochrome b subunit
MLFNGSATNSNGNQLKAYLFRYMLIRLLDFVQSFLETTILLSSTYIHVPCNKENLSESLLQQKLIEKQISQTVGQKVPRLLWNSEVHNCVDKSSPVAPVLNLINLTYISLMPVPN